MTKRELQEKYQVSLGTVRSWVLRGCPHTKDRRGNYVFDARQVERWRRDNMTPKSSATSGLNAAKLRKERALADKHELDVRQRRGELVDKVKTARYLFETGRTVRDAVLSIPDRLAGVVASEGNENRCHELLSVECRRICEDLSRTLKPWEEGRDV